MLIRFGDSPNLSQFGLLCNTEDAGLFSNVSAAMELGLPEVGQEKPNGQPVVICGGGPSLADTLVSIRALKASGAKVYALNNTARFLTEHGIEPDAQVIVDPRPQNVAFIEKPWARDLYLASQCHPAMFAQAKEVGYDTTLWHPAIGGIEKVVRTGKQCFVGGGMTVGLSGLCLAFVQGHREMHLFGYDSSHRDRQSHAYRQDMNAADQMVSCAVDNRVFDCSMTMAAQANDFRNVRDMLEAEGCTIKVYGDGLLPTLAKVWDREKTERTLTAAFDLGLCSPGDFGSFLEAAEEYRVAGKYDHMDVLFQPGPIFGFRNDDEDRTKLKQQFWLDCVGAVRTHPSVRNIEILRARKSVTGDVFPAGYAENAPKSHYAIPQEKTS